MWLERHELKKLARTIPGRAEGWWRVAMMMPRKMMAVEHCEALTGRVSLPKGDM